MNKKPLSSTIRPETTAEVYTHDPKLLGKLRRLAEKYPDQIVKKDRQTFTVPKRCVSVRNRTAPSAARLPVSGPRPPGTGRPSLKRVASEHGRECL